MSTDGITSSWLNLCKEWKSHDIHNLTIEFLCIKDLSNPHVVSQFEKLGFRIHNVKKRGSDLFNYIKSLSKILKANNFDAIHLNGSSSIMAIELTIAKIHGIKHRIVHSHNTMTSNPIVHRILTPIFQKLTTLRVACSDAAGKWLFKNKPFLIFHNGINLNRFSFDNSKRRIIRDELRLKDNTLAIGHVGKFNSQKNHRYLINIFREIHKIQQASHLFLYGDGPLEAEISNLVKELQLESFVHFLGCTDDIESQLQVMDLMLLPSLYEGLPNVVIEWQASGLPSIIASTITTESSVTDLVKFVPLESPYSEWASISLAQVKKHNQRNTQSSNAIYNLKSNGFDISTQVEKLSELYSKIE